MSVPDAPADWQRLDRRMLLVHPVKELVRLLPAVIGFLVAGTSTEGGGWWGWVGVAAPIVLGILRYLTTTYRVADGRVEVRRGLLNRHVLSMPMDRVRTVDLTASPIHRVLGLVTVRVGTGTASTDKDDRVDLDGLPYAQANALRAELLHVSATATAGVAPEENVRVLLRFDPSWARFAPFTSAGLAIAGAAFGVGSQAVRTFGLHLDGTVSEPTSTSGWWIAGFVLLLLALVVVCVLAVGGYLVSNFGFVLTHTRSDGSWHLRRGLLTTRETSLDDARVSGVCISEPLGLRLAGGSRLLAIATGLGKQPGASLLVPPAPVAVIADAAREVLGHPEPVDVPLVPHGPAATRRRWTRALVPAVLLAAAVVVAAIAWGAGWLVLVPAVLAGAAVLAYDRARGLGHALAAGHLIARSGSLNRHREMLATPSVIGWNVKESFFQRRAGLVSLVATTAGARQWVAVPDVPAAEALAVATEATPGMLDPFLA